MAGLRDFLMRWRLRFRPVSTPGPAVGAVPADRSAELAAELQPSLTLLEGAQTEARMIREQATAEAARIRQAAELRAEQIMASAASRAAQVRAQAAAQAHAADAAEAAKLLAHAERDAALVRQRAQERMPALVDQAMADLRRELGLQAADAAGPHDHSGDRCEGRPRWAPDGSPG